MKIKLNNTNITIIEKEELQGDAWGIYDINKQEIYIKKDTTPEQKKMTLIHELSHAIIRSYLLDVKKNYTEEELCEFVALYLQKIKEIVDKYFQPELK